jgi:hypothetical protein
MKVTLEIGDPEGYGHRFRREAVYDFNVESVKELLSAYQKGTNLIGFDLEETCQDYEDNHIPEKIVKKIMKGLSDASVSDWFDNEVQAEGIENIRINYEVYLSLYLEICKLGNPKLTWEEEFADSIDIGGYGLFSE